MIWGFGFRVLSSGYGVQDAGFRVQGFGCRVQGCLPKSFTDAECTVSVTLALVLHLELLTLNTKH